MSKALNTHLAEAYGFADKRHKAVEFGRAIRINGSSVLNPNIHCLIFLYVQEDDLIQMVFSGAIPWDEDVRKHVSNLGKAETDLPGRVSVSFRVAQNSGTAVRSLARAFKSVTASGKRYSTKSWKFSSEEVAADLRRFAATLDSYVTR